MKKQKYEQPEAIVVRLENIDVICASITPDEDEVIIVKP